MFTATEDRIWVKFYDGTGKQILQKELAMGESFTVPGDAQKPMLWTARPDALNVTIGGQAVPFLIHGRGIGISLTHIPSGYRIALCLGMK